MSSAIDLCQVYCQVYFRCTFRCIARCTVAARQCLCVMYHQPAVLGDAMACADGEEKGEQLPQLLCVLICIDLFQRCFTVY